MSRSFSQPIVIENSYLELTNPSGKVPNVAPTGKTRLYYNPSTNTLQVSSNGGGFGSVGSGSGSFDTLTLTSPAAASVPLTINPATSQSGDLLKVKDTGDRITITSGYQIRIATSSGASLAGQTGAIAITGTQNDATTAVVSIENTNAGTAASAQLNLFASGNSGFLAAYASAYTGVSALADRLVLRLNSTSSGAVIYAPTSGQDFRVYTGSTTLTLTVAQTAITHGEGVNMVFGTTTGTKIGVTGGASGEKIGVWGATPIVQPVVATGSTTDQVITALQNIGWFRQS